MKTIRMYKMMPMHLFEFTMEHWALRAAEPYNSLIPMENLPQFLGSFHKDDCLLTAINSRYVFISFTDNPTSPAMWGLYADRGSGIALVFDFPIYEGHQQRVVSKFSPEDDLCRSEGSYELCKISYRSDNTRYKISGKLLSHPTLVQKNLLLNKPQSCSFEQEYRILKTAVESSLCSVSGAMYRAPMRYLKGIIAGPLCAVSPEILRASLKTHKKQFYDRINEKLKKEDIIFEAMRVLYDESEFKFLIDKSL